MLALRSNFSTCDFSGSKKQRTLYKIYPPKRPKKVDEKKKKKSQKEKGLCWNLKINPYLSFQNDYYLFTDHKDF